MHFSFVGSPDLVPAGSAPSLLRTPVPPFPVPSHMPCSPGCQRPTSAGHKRWTRWTSPWWGRRHPRNGLPKVCLPDRRQESWASDWQLSFTTTSRARLTSLLAISVVSETLFVGSFRSDVFQMGPVDPRLPTLCRSVCVDVYGLCNPASPESCCLRPLPGLLLLLRFRQELYSKRAPTTGGSEWKFDFRLKKSVVKNLTWIIYV